MGNHVVAQIYGYVTHADEKVAKVSINHCICFWKEWMFDPNQRCAQLISTAALDQVVDRVIPGATYGGIYHAKELVITERKTSRKKRKKNYSQKVRRHQ